MDVLRKQNPRQRLQINYIKFKVLDSQQVKILVVFNILGFKVLLWIFVCQKFVLSGSKRIFAYGSAVPLKSLGCKSFACQNTWNQSLFINNRVKLLSRPTSTNRTVKIPAFGS